MFRRRGQRAAPAEPAAEPPAPPPDATATAVSEAYEAAQAVAEGKYDEAVGRAAQAWSAATPVAESFAAGSKPETAPAEPASAPPAGAAPGLSDEDLSSIAESVAARVNAGFAAPPPPPPPSLTEDQLDSIAEAVSARVNAAFAAQPPPPPPPPGVSEKQINALAAAVAAKVIADAGLGGGPSVVGHAKAQRAADDIAAAVQSVADDAARQALANAEMEADRRARSNVPWFQGIFLGLGAGALAAYFLSPYSGEELRSLIQARLGGYKSWEPPAPSAGPDPGFARWEAGLRSHPPSSAEIRATAHRWASPDDVAAIEVPSPDAGMPIPGDIPAAPFDVPDVSDLDDGAPGISVPKP